VNHLGRVRETAMFGQSEGTGHQSQIDSDVRRL